MPTTHTLRLYGYAPGTYRVSCNGCRAVFFGDDTATHCSACASRRAERGETVPALGYADLRARCAALERLVRVLVAEDPNADAADGVSVLDVWRAEARAVLGLPAPATDQRELV